MHLLPPATKIAGAFLFFSMFCGFSSELQDSNRICLTLPPRRRYTKGITTQILDKDF